MKSKIFDSYGDALNHVIENRGLKATYLCEKTNIDNGQMSKYLNGLVVPQKKNQKKLAEALNIQLEQLPNGRWKLKEDTRTSMVNDLEVEYSSDDEKVQNLEAAIRIIQITIDEIKKDNNN